MQKEATSVIVAEDSFTKKREYIPATFTHVAGEFKNHDFFFFFYLFMYL